MSTSEQHRSLMALTITLILLVSVGAPAPAQTFRVLYSFTGQPDGWSPFSGLVRDSTGSLYGTTPVGGSGPCTVNGEEVGCGTVFKVDATGQETVLYSFEGSPDGRYSAAGLIRDAAGNLFGTTLYGGDYDDGTVYEVDAAGMEKVLYSFNGSPDGENPEAGLVLDQSGNLYGTTSLGGADGQGTVFKVDTAGQETVLYSFKGTTDGRSPYAGVARDKAGNLYGTTLLGGVHSYGTVYKLDANGKETVLHSFKGMPEGSHPVGGVILDGKGTLYGTTQNGGTSACGGNGGCGTVFKLDKTGKETVLHSFNGNDGESPSGAFLVLDAEDNLYGTTTGGGPSGCVGGFGCGVVFKLNSKGKETVLYKFNGKHDGSYPDSALVRDAKNGCLYGTASAGGDLSCDGGFGCGVVFKITP